MGETFLSHYNEYTVAVHLYRKRKPGSDPDGTAMNWGSTFIDYDPTRIILAELHHLVGCLAVGTEMRVYCYRRGYDLFPTEPCLTYTKETDE